MRPISIIFLILNITVFSEFVDEDGNPINGEFSQGNVDDTQTRAPSKSFASSPPVLTPPSSSGNINFPCTISESKVSVPGFVCKGQLLFEDNFNSGIEKGKVWTPEIMFPAEPVCFQKIHKLVFRL